MVLNKLFLNLLLMVIVVRDTHQVFTEHGESLARIGGLWKMGHKAE